MVSNLMVGDLKELIPIVERQGNLQAGQILQNMMIHPHILKPKKARTKKQASILRISERKGLHHYQHVTVQIHTKS
jgi:hypothetical protein